MRGWVVGGVMGVLMTVGAVHAARPGSLKDKTPEEIRKEGERVFSPDAPADSRPPGAGEREDTPAAKTPVGDDAWVIAISLFTAEEHAEMAEIALRHVRLEGQLPGAYIQPRGKGTLVAVGRFTGPDDPRAQAELDRLHALEINGKRPYALVWLAPPPLNAKVIVGSMPQYDLRHAKAMYGDHAMYTLQVGVYGRRDLPKPTETDLVEVRKAAEAAVVELRQEGEEAFYYHGPAMSTVAVGIFDETDYDPQLPSVMSSRLREAKRLHPYNLYNGAAVKEKRVMGDKVVEVVQSTNLVAIPGK